MLLNRVSIAEQVAVKPGQQGSERWREQEEPFFRVAGCLRELVLGDEAQRRLALFVGDVPQAHECIERWRQAHQ